MNLLSAIIGLIAALFAIGLQAQNSQRPDGEQLDEYLDQHIEQYYYVIQR